MGRPVLARWVSRSLAVAKASLKKISVQQVVSWWARAARLAKTRVRWREERSPVDSLRRRTVMSVSSVRASSSGLRIWRRYASAFGVDSIEGMGSRRHSGRMREC